MTPPEAPQQGSNAEAGTRPPAVSVCLQMLRKRSDFLKVARARRVSRPGFILQMRRRGADEPGGIRVGYTCSKKLGNAVARNRAKRRLREAARMVLPRLGRDGHDYVLIGRPGTTASQPFAALVADLEVALGGLHGPHP